MSIQTMSIQEVTMYRVVCDWPGCVLSEARRHSDTDYYTWRTVSITIAGAVDGDWFTDMDGVHHYCPRHLTEWGGDHGVPVSRPDPPYLLVDDDNRATLIEATPDE